jgi:hypothetical protein
MRDTTIVRLTESIAKVCPIHGISGPLTSVRIDYRDEATAEQRAAAQTVLNSFDASNQFQADWQATQIRQTAADLLNSNEPIALAVRALAKVLMAELQAVKSGKPKPSKDWNTHKTELAAALLAGLGDN